MRYIIAMLIWAAISSNPAYSDTLSVGRYVDKHDAPLPSEIDPLETPVTLEFPRSIQRVGEAINMALIPSGYVADIDSAPEAYILFTLPLPESQRTLGPMSLRRVITTLAGTAFSVEFDDLYRTASFQTAHQVEPGRIDQARLSWAATPTSEIVPRPSSQQIGTEYRVVLGDSVSQIGYRLGVRQSQIGSFIDDVVALNPDAFINNDPNLLRANVDIILPEVEGLM